VSTSHQLGSPRLGEPLPAFVRAFGEPETRGLLLGRIVLSFRFGPRRLLALFTDGQAVAIRCHYGDELQSVAEMEGEARLFGPLDARRREVPVTEYQLLLTPIGWTVAVATCPANYVLAIQQAPL
jgi:hypothetical protein